MKKILTLALSLAMLLSVGIVQVSAMGSLGSYPYLFETYENEDSLASIGYNSSQADLSVVPGGANGSGGSLQVLQKNKGFFDITYPCSLAPVKGQAISLSVWVKLNSEILDTFNSKKCNVVSFIFYGTGTVTNTGSLTDISVGDAWTGNGWKQFDVTDKMVLGQWAKVALDVNWDGSLSIGSGATIGDVQLTKVALRVTGLAGTQALANSDETVLNYQIDDYRIEYPDEDRMGVNNGTVGTYVLDNDFDASAVTGELDGRSDDCSLPYNQVTSASNSKNLDAKFNTVYLKHGHLYKVSGWFRYDKNENSEGNTAKIRQILYATDRDKSDNNNLNASYPSIYPATISAGQWVKVEYYYYFEYQAYDNHNYYIGFRICPEKSTAGTYYTDTPGSGIGSFDKLQVLDLGNAGNMENVGDGLKVYRNFTETQQTFPGWYASNANAEVSTDTASGSGHSMKITVAADYGDMKTSATFEQGKLYRITFKAKTEGLENGTEAPITMILDRKVSTAGTTEIYTVPNYEYMNGPNDFGSGASTEGQKWTVSNEWKEYTGWYYVNFARKEGMEEADDTYIVPRRPMIYFRMNGINPKGSVMYLDDFKIEEMADSSIYADLQNGLAANVKDISVAGTVSPGSAISLSYTYEPVLGGTENAAATAVRAYTSLADGTERNYGVFPATESFTVPTCAAGEDLTFEIIPISTAGLSGNRASVTVAVTDYLVYDAANAKVMAGCSKASAKIIYASYDNSGAMTSVAVTDATFTDGKFEETVPVSFAPGAGDTVKVMMWTDFKNCIPICRFAQ